MSFMDDFLLAGGADTGFYTADIPYSCRFDSARSCYLYKTPSTAGNSQKSSLSACIKRAALGVNQYIFSAGTGSTDSTMFTIVVDASDKIEVTGFSSVWFLSTEVFRDPSQHLHIFVVIDTTLSTAADRVQVWVNGVRLTNASSTYPSQNATLAFNTAVLHTIGKQSWGTAYYLSAYLSNIYWIDGTALTASTFGQFSSKNSNVWIPKTPSGLTYGTNGFYLAFGNASALGTDTSGQGNNFTSSGLTTADQMADTPTNNFCTLNPIWAIGTANALSNGNLTGTGSARGRRSGTMVISSGKIYFEMKNDTYSGLGNYTGVGVSLVPTGNSAQDTSYAGNPTSAGANSFEWLLTDRGIACNGSTYNNISAAIGTFAQGDVIQVAVDRDAGKIWFGRNNTWSGNPAAGTGEAFSNITADVMPLRYTMTTFAQTFNFGATPFAYTPPTGFKALRSANLPDPAIIDSSKGFDAKLYTGNGSTQNITSFNFQPDLVWLKNRAQADSHMLLDAVRGATKRISSNLTDAEATDSTGLTAFLTNGFTLGTGANGYNDNAENFVSWCWKKGAAYGFDIVSFVGTGANRTVAHNLGAVPELMIFKNRDVANRSWGTYHKNANASPQNYVLYLDQVLAAAADATFLNNTAPTSTVFTVGTAGGVNENTKNIIAYLFRSVPGFSLIGSYTGNGNADGPFVYCGFRPRFIMVKRTDTTGDWCSLDAARDTYNGVQKFLYPSGTYAEQTSVQYDFLSNGFKLRGTATNTNTSGATYIFVAFAEAPFKFANAR